MKLLYHNPRCSKSRQTLALLDENNVKFETIEYLKVPPSSNELKEIVSKLGFDSPHDLIRTKEDIYKELDVSSSKGDKERLIKLMVENPKLIERPIFVTDNKAAIGRPPEAVLELL